MTLDWTTSRIVRMQSCPKCGVGSFLCDADIDINVYFCRRCKHRWGPLEIVKVIDQPKPDTPVKISP